ncbi:MAG: hypothetical protein EPN89_02065 [Methylovulum sp.]|nr:MAG: hypothetical protein EPN89_02065 [Methylovulum sp.]
MIRNINYHIIPECYLDTNLVETIVPPQGFKGSDGYNHQHTCNDVVKLIRTKLNDNFAVGIVDRDKRKLEHTDEFKLLVSKQNLELYVHPDKNHYLIFHKPIEKWLIEEAGQCGMSLATHNLPTTLKELTRISKRESSKTDQRFKNLFRDLKTQNASGINLLAKWIEHLKANPYNADKTTLQNL